jgi:uncharacterized protein (TIGR03435 family)
LADRFHLQSHLVSREIPAYALIVAKGGAKLTEVKPEVNADGHIDPGGIRVGEGQITATAAAMTPLIDALSVQLGQPVIDRTGLVGHYNFILQFAPVQASPDAQPDARPSLFTAIQEQLGLKLESTKAPVDVVVIDHIEKPSEN